MSESTVVNIPKDADLPGNQHIHACGCGDYRVCSRDCDRGNRDPWTCPDCEVTEKLEALHRQELARINQLHAVLDRVYPGIEREK